VGVRKNLQGGAVKDDEEEVGAEHKFVPSLLSALILVLLSLFVLSLSAK
jgi:hypothetical protein